MSVDTTRGPVPALAGGPADSAETPVFYLHGEGGLSAQDPFLLELIKTRRVVAPFLPGFADIPAATHSIFLGRVEHLIVGPPGTALLYVDGRYAEVGPTIG